MPALPLHGRRRCLIALIAAARRRLPWADTVVKCQALALNFPTDEVFLTTEEVLEYLQINLRTEFFAQVRAELRTAGINM